MTVHNFRIFWLNANFDETNDLFQTSLGQLRKVISTVNIFTDVDYCIDSLTEIKDDKIFMLISDTFGKYIVPIVHDIPQLRAIFISCSEKTDHKERMQQWPKVGGAFTQIKTICEALEHVIKQYEEDLVPFSLITADEEDSFITARHFLRLDRPFMHIYLLKDVFSGIDDYDDTKSVTALTAYCRQVYAEDLVQLNKIAKFEHEFHDHALIWWYTNDYFLLSMLNRAIRTLNIEFIFRVGFVVRILLHHISKLRQKQSVHHQVPFCVYRRQALSEENFQKLQHARGGLLSFNSFLSTTVGQPTTTMFHLDNSDTVIVLFIMHIDPTSSVTPFAALGQKVDYFGSHEQEILFCMHAIFRIGQIKQVGQESSRMWHVHLTLTAVDEPKLVALSNRIQEETGNASGWLRVGALLIEVGEIAKAEELYRLILEERTNDLQIAEFGIRLGKAYLNKGMYHPAISSYKNALATIEKKQLWNRPLLAGVYSAIALAHSKAGEYPQALTFQEKALCICENARTPDALSFSMCCFNIGYTYLEMSECSKALFYFEKALVTLQKLLTPTHPVLKNCEIGIETAKK